MAKEGELLKTTHNKLGRPSKYSEELSNRICELLSQGNSLRTVCKPDEMPSMQTVFSWFKIYPDFLDNYTRAKQEAADALAEELLDIADDGTNDWMEIHKGDYEGWQLNGEALQRSKLRVDTRKWLMAKMKPKKYGEKMEVDNKHTFVQPILGGVAKKQIENETPDA